jgi:acyl-CoA thioesterase-1
MFSGRFSDSVCAAGVCVLITLAGACGTRDSTPPGDVAQAQQTEPKPVPARHDPGRPKVVVLGDSLTAGLGLIETQSYPALLQKKIEAEGLAFEVVNAGISGDTSAGGLRRLDWALQDGDVRILIVALGANDGLRGLPVAEMKQNLARIIDAARARKIVVLLAGMEAPPNYGVEYASSFRQAYRDLAREQEVPLIPFLLVRVAGQQALNQGDGVHPNPAGAAIVADTVWAALEPLLGRLAGT